MGLILSTYRHPYTWILSSLSVFLNTKVAHPVGLAKLVARAFPCGAALRECGRGRSLNVSILHWSCMRSSVAASRCRSGQIARRSEVSRLRGAKPSSVLALAFLGESVQVGAGGIRRCRGGHRGYSLSAICPRSSSPDPSASHSCAVGGSLRG